LVLQASPVELGMLGMLQSVPFVLFGLAAGVWVDRLHRRPLLIGADVGRAILLGSVPLAAVMGWLSMPQLYLVSFGVGTLNVIFSVAYGSFLPSLVSRSELQEGNAKLALAEAISRVAGLSLGGTLVQLLTAPIAIVVDAASFVVSAGSVLAIRASERPPAPHERKHLLAEIAEGARATLGHSLLRPLMIGSNLGNLADGLLFGSNVALLYFSRELGFAPATIGLVLSGLGVGGLIGAALAGPATRQLGYAATILGSLLLWSVGFGGLALALQPLHAAVLLGLVGAINPVAGANISTLRQTVTPDRLLGRVTATTRVGVWASIALGSALGGVLAEQIGLRATVLLSGVLPLLGFVWVLASPIRRLRSLDSYAAPCSNDC
jgi:MFS family permease